LFFFAAGPRMCAGYRITWLFLKITLITILRDFTLVSSDRAWETSQSVESSATFGMKDVWIKLIKRQKKSDGIEI